MADIYKERLFEATLCERSERYEEMVENMNAVVKLAFEHNAPLNLKANNSFSVAYKNLTGARRASFRVLTSEKCKREGDEEWRRLIIDKLLDRVKAELCEVCGEVLKMIDSYILPKEDIQQNKESKIFFLKMKGDYYRYKAEVEESNELKISIEQAKMYYEEATQESLLLPPTTPVRLGLALNYSVFYYEILQKPKEACELAKNSFDSAIAELEKLSEEHYKDSTLTMQLLRDNLTLWTSQSESSRNDRENGDFVNNE